VERIYDIYPYPRGRLRIVILDAKGAAMATAPPERSKPHFYTYKDVPILWYLTSTTVAMQGELMGKILLDHIHKDSSLTAIDVIWIPCSGIPDLMFLPRDIYEVVDSVEKAKEIGIKYKVDIKVSLATSWLPLGNENHEAALRVFTNNKALLVVGYFWLRCRVTDLIHTTTHEVRGRDKEDTMQIRDLEDFKFVADMYVDQHHGGMEIDEHAGRQIREILRRVFLQYGLEPNWESAINSTGRFYRIPEPKVHFNGRSRRLPEPTAGNIPPHQVVRRRAEIRQAYIAGRSEDRALPPTHLEEYPWQYLLARSNRPEHPQPELTPLHLSPLCSSNRILAMEVSTLSRPVRLAECVEPTIKPAVPKVPANLPITLVKPADTPTTTTKPAANETVTKISSSSRQSRTPAMNRLGPRARTSSEPAIRSRSSPRSSRDRQEVEKGEPSKPTSREQAALVIDLSADKSSDDRDMEPANKTSEGGEPDPAEAAANKSLEDVDQDEDTEADAKTDSSELGLTDEEEASDFRQLLADLSARFEAQQTARRQKRDLKIRAEKRERK